MLEAIRISCAGYPTKRTFDEFLDRFGMLAPDISDGYRETDFKLHVCFGLALYIFTRDRLASIGRFI